MSTSTHIPTSPLVDYDLVLRTGRGLGQTHRHTDGNRSVPVIHVLGNRRRRPLAVQPVGGERAKGRRRPEKGGDGCPQQPQIKDARERATGYNQSFPRRPNTMQKSKETFVDGNAVVASTAEFSSCNQLRVTVGTNCPQGGDSGHGGRTVLILENPNGDFRCGIDGAPVSHASKVEIVAGGDSEFQTLLEGLEFAVETLRLLERANCSRDGKPKFQPAE